MRSTITGVACSHRNGISTSGRDRPRSSPRPRPPRPPRSPRRAALPKRGSLARAGSRRDPVPASGSAHAARRPPACTRRPGRRGRSMCARRPSIRWIPRTTSSEMPSKSGTLHGREDVPRAHHRDRRADAADVLEPDDDLLDLVGVNPQVDERVHSGRPGPRTRGGKGRRGGEGPYGAVGAGTRHSASSASAPSSGPTAIRRSPARSTNGPRGR